ncbi:glycosyltransferase family 4 protein [Campylobacter sp. MIT 12-8780]|uniref:glycosyltransferase n=1 Tax=unclassified Campylobacter TaxID=2593542 RepID=UPI00115CC0EA|nr:MULTISPECIES: glycosyltransferase [unclassified Campylobacter]NDJ27747.1 glycosyltransferase family 4 protein [Campylobacter sp. MIT 19-121]TQR41045.1 glycosyltransferase family 4 protein [Campylobacter sp. MIT 12-8780]
MKICFIIASLGNGGAERVLVSLANEFCKKHSVQIIKFDDKESFYKLDESIYLKELPKFNWQNLYHKIASRIKKFLALRKAMKEAKADIFISFLDTTNIACVWAKIGLKSPLIISEHSTQSYLKSKIWRFLRRLSYPHAQALTVLSLQDKSYYEAFVSKVELIFNPCHFSICQNPKKENLVLFVGRLDANKNPALFLRAISNLSADLRATYRFCIAGDGELKDELILQAQELGIKVEFLGRVKDMQSLYEKAKILCLCSFVEGLPTVLIETLFFKIARISTDYVNSARDLISPDFDGFLVALDDEKAMAKALEKLMSDESLREQIAQKALKRCENFSIQNIEKQWFKLISELQ